MSERSETPEPSTDIERLIVDIFTMADVVCTIATADRRFVAELMGRTTPYFHGDRWKVETAGWHLHARLSAIQRVRFVRAPSDHFAGQDALSIRLEDDHGGVLLTAYFIKLYDPENRPLAGRFACWEELRARYGGRDDVMV